MNARICKTARMISRTGAASLVVILALSGGSALATHRAPEHTRTGATWTTVETRCSHFDAVVSTTEPKVRAVFVNSGDRIIGHALATNPLEISYDYDEYPPMPDDFLGIPSDWKVRVGGVVVKRFTVRVGCND